MTPRRSRIALLIGLAAMAILALLLGILRQGDAPTYPAIPALEDLDPPAASPAPPRTPRAARLPVPPTPTPASEAPIAAPGAPATSSPRLEDHLNPVAAPHSGPAAQRPGLQYPADDSPTPARPSDDPDLAAALADPANPNRWVNLADRFRVERRYDLEAAALRRAMRVAREPSLAETLRNRVRQAETDAMNAPKRSSTVEFPAPTNP